MNFNGFFFNPGDRYVSNNLNYMGVLYESRDDIFDWRGGYSSTDDCPWEFAHDGIDFFLNNGSNVLAAAPGQIESIEARDSGSSENKYWVSISIRYNSSFTYGYNFEPWTNEDSDWVHQQSLITVNVGDWVEKGQIIGKFLSVDPDGAHIHFDVHHNDEKPCPLNYFSTEAIVELNELADQFNYDGELCY